MGKGGKGGGGGGQQAPQVGIPAGLSQTIASTSGLGQYASGLLDPLASMTNWAAGIASGGRAGQIPGFQATAIQAGPQVNFGGGGAGGSNLWNSSFDPTTGLITYTNAHAPQQTFQTALDASINPKQYGQFGDLPQSVIQQWSQDYAQHKAGASPGGGGGTPGGATGDQLLPGISMDQVNAWYQKNYGQPAPDASTAIYQFNKAWTGATGNQSSQLGPFLGTAWNAIKTQEGLPSQMKPIEAQTANLANEAQTEGQTLMTEATTGTGLFPSQAAFVEQSRQTGQTEEAAMLAKLGLSESTMAPQLKEEANLAADATAGQLVQGNIALAQASQKIALGAQALETSEQQAVFDMFSAIASESVGFQKNMWDEALSGYGVLGQIIDTAAKSYGLSLGGYNSILQAEETNAANQTALDQAELKAASSADSSSTSGLFGMLGNILGGGGSGGGGGLLGGLIGGGGAALGAGSGVAAGLGAGAAGGAGAAIADIAPLIAGLAW